jgi:hypothetical protein
MRPGVTHSKKLISTVTNWKQTEQARNNALEGSFHCNELETS